MGEPSKAELRRQIEREGRPWGLTHMETLIGTTVVAETCPVKIPLDRAISVLVPCLRDVCEMSQAYPWNKVLRSRISRDRRRESLALEITALHEAKNHESKMEAIHHTYGKDLAKALKDL